MAVNLPRSRAWQPGLLNVRGRLHRLLLFHTF
jgi:hypothetical protein